MSDTPTGKATDTVLKTVERVVIAEGTDNQETLVVGTFVVAKTLLAFEIMTQLVEAAGVADIMATANQAGANGEFEGENPISATFVTKIVSALPTALRQGQRPLYELVGLIVTSNNKLFQLEDSSEDVREYLFKEGRRIARFAELPDMVNLVMAGARQLGVETILGNVKTLLAVVTSNQ